MITPASQPSSSIAEVKNVENLSETVDGGAVYSFYGLALRSELVLHTFPLFQGVRSADSTAYFCRGQVPLGLQKSVYQTSLLQIDAAGTVLCSVGTVGRFLLCAGDSIVADAPDASDDVLECILNPTLAGLLLHQRKAAALRATVVATAQGGIAFLGLACAGKSTLAGSLIERGAGTLLTDGLAVTTPRHETIQAKPGSNSLRLWPDSIQAMALPAHRIHALRPGLALQRVTFPKSHDTTSLRAAIFLEFLPQGKDTITLERCSHRMWFDRRTVFHSRSLAPFFQAEAAEFEILTSAANTVPPFRLQLHHRSLQSLRILIDEAADLVANVLC